MQEVRAIARKFPDFSGQPCSYHVSLCANNLMGSSVPMDGRVPIPRGRSVKQNNKTAAIFEPSPETAAFVRWQRGEFLEVERLFAADWRRKLAAFDSSGMSRKLGATDEAARSCRTLERAREVACRLVNEPRRIAKELDAAGILFGLQPGFQAEFLSRMQAANRLALTDCAPYAAHVLTVETFFELTLSAGLLSSGLKSNRTDMAYLNYLPFCHIFVSSDHLHRECAPLFLRSNQSFVWGYDLKADLSRLNDYYAQLPEKTRDMGVCSFASSPPKDGSFLVCRCWDRYDPGWRRDDSTVSLGYHPELRSLQDEIEKLRKAPSSSFGESDSDAIDPDVMLFERLVRKRRGSWWQVPRTVAEDSE